MTSSSQGRPHRTWSVSGRVFSRPIRCRRRAGLPWADDFDGEAFPSQIGLVDHLGVWADDLGGYFLDVVSSQFMSVCEGLKISAVGNVARFVVLALECVGLFSRRD